MRKILLVHNERYLDQALKDVFRLVGIERQLTCPDEIPDLLAVVLTPLSGDAHITSQDQTCELGCMTNYARIFSPETASVSGIWLLLTVSQSVIADSMKRQEALSRILNVLQVTKGVPNIRAVFPAFPSDESQDSIAKQIAYLDSKHPDIPMTSTLTVDFQEHPPTLSKVGLRTVAE